MIIASFYGLYPQDNLPAIATLNCDKYHNNIAEAVKFAEWLLQKTDRQYNAILLIERGGNMLIIANHSLAGSEPEQSTRQKL